MTELRFEIKGEPKGKGRPRFYGGHAVTPKETREYERLVEDACLAAMKDKNVIGASPDAEVEVKVIAYFSIPRSWTKSKIYLATIGMLPCIRKPDADNIAKIIMDGLNGILYDDDKSVTRLEVIKCYSNVPRVAVEVKYTEAGR